MRRFAIDRRQIVARLGIEKSFFRQRPRRDEAHDIALDDGLGAALSRFSRIFELLADRNAISMLDQTLEIFVGPVHRHAAHRNIPALMLAAFGQNDRQGF